MTNIYYHQFIIKIILITYLIIDLSAKVIISRENYKCLVILYYYNRIFKKLPDFLANPNSFCYFCGVI